MRNLIRTIREACAEFFRPAVAVAEAVAPRLSPSKVILSVGKNPGEFTPEDWFNAFAAKNDAAIEQGEDVKTAALCPWPGCTGHMLQGPSAGMSENIKCDTCERKWNLTAMIRRMERI